MCTELSQAGWTVMQLGGHAVVGNDNLVILHQMLTLSDFNVDISIFHLELKIVAVHVQIYLNVSV